MIMLLTTSVLLVALGAWLVWKSARVPIRARIAQRLVEVGRTTTHVVPEPDPGERGAYATRLFSPIRRTLLVSGIAFRTVYLIPFAAIAIAVSTLGFFLNGYITAAAIAIFAAATVMYFRDRAERNRRRFLETLPSLVDRLQQFLGAGNSLVNAFEKALDYSTPLTRHYLQPVAIRLAHGATIADSLLLQGERLGIAELTMMSVIFHANLQFGGSLGDVLTRLVEALNNRLQVQREFNAMTAEMRSSAKVLVALPLVVSGAVFATNPHYLSFFAHDHLGRTLIVISVGWVLMGVVVLRHMTRIEG